MGAVAKSYTVWGRASFSYEEMRKNLVIYEEARSLLDFLIYGENLVFFFISAGSLLSNSDENIFKKLSFGQRKQECYFLTSSI
jgi:hypothetical protein